MYLRLGAWIIAASVTTATFSCARLRRPVIAFAASSHFTVGFSSFITLALGDGSGKGRVKGESRRRETKAGDAWSCHMPRSYPTSHQLTFNLSVAQMIGDTCFIRGRVGRQRFKFVQQGVV